MQPNYDRLVVKRHETASDEGYIEFPNSPSRVVIPATSQVMDVSFGTVIARGDGLSWFCEITDTIVYCGQGLEINIEDEKLHIIHKDDVLMKL